MVETCPHLAYRRQGDGTSFEDARAYCTVVDSFVQPMRADVCNVRYGLDPARDCEFYVEPGAAGAGDPDGTEDEEEP